MGKDWAGLPTVGRELAQIFSYNSVLVYNSLAAAIHLYMIHALGLKAFFGKNGSKRLMKCYVSTPSMVEALEKEKVLSVSCGKYWSFAIVQ